MITFDDKASRTKNSFKFSRSTIFFAIFFIVFKRFNFFTSSRFLSNIFCSRSFKNRFYSRKRFNLNNFERIKSFAIFNAISIFVFSRFNLFIVLSISSKLINDINDSYFFLRRINFSYFRNTKKQTTFFLISNILNAKYHDDNFFLKNSSDKNITSLKWNKWHET